MYNPDYPTDEGAGFLQHTYQNTPRSDMFFWNGYSGMPSMGCYNDGSRRNMMNPVNPMAPDPFATFGNTQPAVPEQSVQPFSSYPPATPAPGGLNAAIESRRNIPNQAANQNNPWVKTPQTAPAPNMGGYAPNSQPPTYFGSNPYGGYYGPDANTMSLYGNNSFGFDKRNSWENYYTQNRPFPMPVIDWQAQQQQNQQNAGYGCPNPYGMNPYQVQQFPTAPLNWKDKAMENWSYQK